MRIGDLEVRGVGFKLLMLFMFWCPMFFDGHSAQFGVASLRMAQNQFFQLGAGVLFVVVLLDSFYLSAFALWVITLYIAQGMTSIGGLYLTNVLWGCVLYQVAYKLVDERTVRYIFRILLWFCAANIVWIVLQIFRCDFMFMQYSAKGEWHNDTVGLMGLKAHMGTLFALCTPFLLRWKWWLVPGFAIPIYLSHSTAAALGYIVAILWYAWFKSRKLFVVLTLLGVIIGGCYAYKDTVADNMMNDRFYVWKVSLRDGAKHLVVGCGLDSFRNITRTKPYIYLKNNRTSVSGVAFPLKDRNAEGRLLWKTENGLGTPDDSYDPWDNPHNEYVQMFYEFGLVGIIILLFMMRDVAKRFKPTPNSIALVGSFIALGVVSIGQFPMHVTRTAYMMPILYAAYIKLTEGVDNGKR